MGEALLASVYVQALQLDQQTVQWNPLSSGYTQLSLYSVPQPPRSYRVVGLNITENTYPINTQIDNEAVQAGTQYQKATDTFHQFIDGVSAGTYGFNFYTPADAAAFADAISKAITDAVTPPAQTVQQAPPMPPAAPKQQQQARPAQNGAAPQQQQQQAQPQQQAQAQAKPAQQQQAAPKAPAASAAAPTATAKQPQQQEAPAVSSGGGNKFLEEIQAKAKTRQPSSASTATPESAPTPSTAPNAARKAPATASQPTQQPQQQQPAVSAIKSESSVEFFGKKSGTNDDLKDAFGNMALSFPNDSTSATHNPADFSAPVVATTSITSAELAALKREIMEGMRAELQQIKKEIVHAILNGQQ